MAIDPKHPNITAQVDMFPANTTDVSSGSPRVFVTQATNLDLVKATRFGELYPLVAQNLNVVMQPTEVIDALYNGLSEYTPEDFLLPTGDPVIIGLAFIAASEISGGFLRVLKWDRQINDYYPVRLNLNDR